MSAVETPSINLLDPGFYVDPWDAYRWLRANDPVHWDPIHRIWGISRYADIVEVEKNTALYTSVEGSRPATDQHDDTSMINRDDPDHQQQRMLVARQFTPRAVRQIEDQLRSLVNELIDGVIQDGTCEAIESLASPLPAIIIGDKLGFPRELWPKLREWSEITMYESGQNPPDGTPAPISERSTTAIMEFVGVVMELIAARRAKPENDLISIWANTEVDGRRWDEGEIISECLLLLDGGAETTRTVIGSIIRELALDDHQRRMLAARPQILGETAVEEFIRWVTPILNMRRTATRDHEFHGRDIHAGDEILLMYASANRDESMFDRPEVFDVTRAHNHHVAFGFGTHFCLGASLARIEIRVMFEELLRRIPDWRLVPGTEPQILGATFTRAYDAVHIEFDRA
ncbi:MAG: cytochrome P450 [Actinobacteria bacterium]|nr:cytochrome P450 [Actinomycetota bacterium]